MLFSFEGMINTQESGDDSKGDPPVPMPNTEVKPLNVDDTWRVTAWESRTLPTQKARFYICKTLHIFLVSSVGRAYDC